MADPGPGDRQQLNVKVPEDELPGRYANLLRIFHTREEFVLEFINAVPPQPVVTARVVTSPGHVKRILKALAQNLERYEAAFGEVPETPAPGPEGPVH